MFNYCDKVTSQLKKQNNKKDYLQENQSNSTMTDTIKNIVDIQTKVEKKNAKEIVNLKTLQITTSSPKKKNLFFNFIKFSPMFSNLAPLKVTID